MNLNLFTQAVGSYKRYAEMFEEAAKALDAAFSRGTGDAITIIIIIIIIISIIVL